MKNILTIVFAIATLFCNSQSIIVKFSEKVDISNELEKIEESEDLGVISGFIIKQMISNTLEDPFIFELKGNSKGESIYLNTDEEEESSFYSVDISSNEDIVYTNYIDKTFTKKAVSCLVNF